MSGLPVTGFYPSNQILNTVDLMAFIRLKSVQVYKHDGIKKMALGSNSQK